MNLTSNVLFLLSFSRLVDSLAALVGSMVVTYPGYLEFSQSNLKQDFNSF